MGRLYPRLYNAAVRLRFALATAAALLAAIASLRALGPIPPPACPAQPAPAIGPDIPEDVCIPDGFTDIPMEYFDDYSWRAFVALVWPAAPNRRGVPAADKPIGAPGPRVFETYKALWEVFHADGSAPDARADRYDAAAHNPCRAAPAFGDVTIGSASGIDDIGQAGIGSLDPPVVAQNGRYIRTLTLFDPSAFDHIVGHQYYLRSRLPEVPRPRPDRPVIDFPMGAVAVKTAWIDVADLPAPLVRRMYTRSALVKRAGGTDCSRRTIGLIGMHIAQKTPSRPQWIWSSFEQKDVVPPAWPDSPGFFVLNDGRGGRMPEKNPLSLAPLAPEPVAPFNVVRSERAPLLTSTELTSFAYQRLLAGTPWQYYKLVLTQWPRLDGNQATPVPATQDGSVPHTFPGTGAFSAFANVTMETFDQTRIELGCMNCHNRARMAADFMWTLLDHAYPPRFSPTPAR